jgi:hypothetical protein
MGDGYCSGSHRLAIEFPKNRPHYNIVRIEGQEKPLVLNIIFMIPTL